jgi:3-(3-hydroxy-phenyl)propionate hydroxylase
VVSCGQSDDTVEIGAEDAGGELTYYRADFVVAADGARSAVRALSQVDFEGFTYPERFVILSTPFDFMAHEGYAYRNYLFHPDEWGALFKIAWAGPPGIWRLVLPASPETSLEDLRRVETAQARLQRFLPREEPYEIPFHNAYTVDQRVAATFRKGRVLLAGDAAHLNNPLGAMGLNSGIHDAVSLAENLIRVAHGVEGDGALDRYARQRRYVAVNHVQTVSAAQKRALEQKDPAKLESYYDELRRTAADPESAKSFLMVASLIDSLREAAQVS